MSSLEALKTAMQQDDAHRVRWLLDDRPALVHESMQNEQMPQLTYLPIHWAASSGRTEIVRALISRRANLNYVETSTQQWTPLHFAVFHNHLETAKLLLESGAAVDPLDGRGKTPFHWAVFKNLLPMAELLLAHGANINLKIRDWSLLHHEAKDGRNETVEFLLKHGADPNIKDDRGQPGSMPLHGAARHGRLIAAKLLLDHGANINAKTKLGETPLAAAKKANKKAMIALLIEHGARNPLPTRRTSIKRKRKISKR